MSWEQAAVLRTKLSGNEAGKIDSSQTVKHPDGYAKAFGLYYVGNGEPEK